MLIIRAIAAALLSVAALPAQAENFPSRAIKLVVPYAAGATGAIGTQSVAAAAPDGHTLLVGQTGEIAINPHWSKNIGYDPDKDLVPVALATIVPLALVVPGKASYGTMAELLKVAQERGLSFASAGTATPGHFAGEV